jgi:hypothetical protein
MEKILKRRLRRGEIVHHIDGDRTNNSIENLYLCRDRKQHNEVHRSQDVALRELLKRGYVKFENGKYQTILSRR